jgi:hypothetical protein
MADTPFGLSFGNPSMYMGKSPLAEIGKALKTGLMVGALESTGARAYLDSLGLKTGDDGKVTYKKPGIAPPVSIASDPGMSPDGVWGKNPMVAKPMSFGIEPPIQQQNPEAGAVPGVNVTPIPNAPYTPTITAPVDAGQQILDNNYTPPISYNNMDFNPTTQQTGYNQMLATGNEYQQIPGYGRAAKVAKTMFGMG